MLRTPSPKQSEAWLHHFAGVYTGGSIASQPRAGQRLSVTGKRHVREILASGLGKGWEGKVLCDTVHGKMLTNVYSPTNSRPR